jgi:alcohol dehydrogenase class IV
LTEIATFQVPTHLHFGPGAVANIAEVCAALKTDRLLVVTDPGLVNCGIAPRVVDLLTEAGIESAVFDTVEPNPSIETVEQALALFQKADSGGIVAVGGGSPMDVAKAVGVLARNSGPFSSYVGIGKVENPLPVTLALPTTVGTGSEVTNFAVITDQAQRKKVVIGSPLLAPKYAFLDPELVLTLPPSLVASTGMDALTHAIESVISVFATPFTDGVALEAIRLIAANLTLAVRSAELESRANLLYASTMAGIAFSYARTGLVHGMAHPLSSYYGVQHGLANAILLPYVLAFNAPACGGGLTRIAVAMGETAMPGSAVEAIRRLGTEVGIPAHLREVGVTEEFIPQMAQDAFESGNAQVVNPRKPSLSEVNELFLQAL